MSNPIRRLKFKTWLIVIISVILSVLVICSVISFLTKDTYENNKPQIPEIITPQENAFPEHIEDKFNN